MKREYFGFEIEKDGSWWVCEICGRVLQADTLNGIKYIIRARLKALWPETYGNLKTTPIY